MVGGKCISIANVQAKIGDEACARLLVVHALGGFIVDSSMTFLPYISRVISSCFYQLRQMKSSVKVLPFGTARTTVNCFVISRIDYCNSLLANIPHCHLNRLQRVMNAVTRLVCHAGRRAHVSEMIRDRLHLSLI